jgi:hypothetical protein
MSGEVGAAAELPGQVAHSTVSDLATPTKGSSLSPPSSSVPRLHIRRHLLLGLPLCNPVALESQHAYTARHIAKGGQSDRSYPVLTHLGPNLDRIWTL